MRVLSRLVLTASLALLLAVPAAQAASKSAPAAPPPQPAPSGGSIGAPITNLAGQDTSTAPTTTTVNTKRPGETSNGHGTLILLTIVALVLIVGVAFLIWYEGRHRRATAKRRRQRLRSGRTPQPHAVGGDGRRGPPPPPRKRRAQAAKRKRR